MFVDISILRCCLFPVLNEVRTEMPKITNAFKCNIHNVNSYIYIVLHVSLFLTLGQFF